MTAKTKKKLRDKLMKEKKPEMKEIIELIKQGIYEKKIKSQSGGSSITTKSKKNKKHKIFQERKSNLTDNGDVLRMKMFSSEASCAANDFSEERYSE